MVGILVIGYFGKTHLGLKKLKRLIFYYLNTLSLTNRFFFIKRETICIESDLLILSK